MAPASARRPRLADLTRRRAPPAGFPRLSPRRSPRAKRGRRELSPKGEDDARFAPEQGRPPSSPSLRPSRCPSCRPWRKLIGRRFNNDHLLVEEAKVKPPGIGAGSARRGPGARPRRPHPHQHWDLRGRLNAAVSRPMRGRRAVASRRLAAFSCNRSTHRTKRDSIRDTHERYAGHVFKSLDSAAGRGPSVATALLAGRQFREC